MIDALISGKLMGTPTQRTSKNGNHFTVAKVRVPNGDEAMFCNVICFAEGVQAALLALGDGDAVALAGSLKVGTYQAKDGTHRASLDLTATQVLTAYHVTKKRKAMQPEPPPSSAPMQRQTRPGPAGNVSQPLSNGFDDGMPLDF